MTKDIVMVVGNKRLKFKNIDEMSITHDILMCYAMKKGRTIPEMLDDDDSEDKKICFGNN